MIIYFLMMTIVWSNVEINFPYIFDLRSIYCLYFIKILSGSRNLYLYVYIYYKLRNKNLTVYSQHKNHLFLNCKAIVELGWYFIFVFQLIGYTHLNLSLIMKSIRVTISGLLLYIFKFLELGIRIGVGLGLGLRSELPLRLGYRIYRFGFGFRIRTKVRI